MKLKSFKAQSNLKHGFSLIELMIVLVIIAILSSVAIPSYRQYLIKSRRHDGQAALLDLANRMEIYYAENNNFNNTTIASGDKTTDVSTSRQSPAKWYTLVIANHTAASYTLYAVPNKVQALDDTICQTLTLDNFGHKDIKAGPITNPSGAAEQCW